MIIRAELEQDHAAVRSVVESAFGSTAEADLVEVLRTQARPIISLVALERDAVVGHVMFSPVSLDGHPDLRILALAPLAVVPASQRSGVGSALTSAGLEACARLPADAVVVLGHPSYYPRFGFRPASGFGIGSEFRAAPEAFMVLELETGCLHGRSGTIRYHPAFEDV